MTTEPLSILNIGGHSKDAILYAGGTTKMPPGAIG